MEHQQQRESDRVNNVKTIAARLATAGTGMSVREYLDASALAAAVMIKAIHRGPGRDIAMKRYIEALQRGVNSTV